MTTTASRLHRITARIRRVYAELDYAHRREFELQTGIGSVTAARVVPPRVSVEDLEALYAMDLHDDDAT